MSLLLLLKNGEGEAPPEETTISRSVIINHEFPPDQLSVTLYEPTTGQKIARWAEDEKRAENVLSGIKKSGRMNGGHTEMSGTLNRDPRESFPDLEPYTDLTLAGAGGTAVWEGRLDKAPEVDGQRMAIEPAAVGHSKALEDRGGVRVGFINSDLGAWRGMSSARKIQLLGTGFAIGDANPDTDPYVGLPALRFDIEGDFPKIAVEAWFDAGSSIRVGNLLWDRISKSNLGLGNPSSTFNFYAHFEEEDANLGEVSSDLQTSNEAAETGRNLFPGSGVGRRFAGFLWEFPAANNDAYTYSSYVRNLKVIAANTGLALQGTWPEVGYTAKQMLEYAVPKFSYLEVNPELVETENFIVPHAWFGEPTPLATIVQELTKYELLRWYVLKGKRFELRKPGTFGRKWQASVGPSELQEAGNDGSRLWREIVVRWEDVSGMTLTAGPPGSGCNIESAGLEITDPEHPAVKAGIAREDLLDLSGVSEANFAVQVGERWLKEANEVSRSGQATLRGYCLESKGVFRPVSQVEPGDQIRFPDAGSGGTDYREVVQVDYEHDSRTATVTLDAPKESIQALLERYRAELKARANR